MPNALLSVPMAYMEILVSSIIVFFCFRFFLPISKLKKGQPWNWPIVGMLPMLFLNFNNILDKISEILEHHNGTFPLENAGFPTFQKKTWFISNPANVHHIMSTKFSNYPKGTKSKEIFDVFGDLLFNADLEEWRRDRKTYHALFSDKRFHQFGPKVTRNTLEKGLVPVLQHASQHGLVVDFQDVFKRFMFDTTFCIITGIDPGSLRVGVTDENAFSTALDDVSRAVFVRQTLPKRVWMLQKWLGIGEEKKMSEAHKTLDEITRKYVTMRQEQLLSKDQLVDENERFDGVKFFTQDVVEGSPTHPYSDIRDTVIGLTFAGRDATSVALTWFFWLISRNLRVQSSIREELDAHFPEKQRTMPGFLDEMEVALGKLNYLQAALCETLRLYPPIPMQARSVVESDTLPSGHRIEPAGTTKVVICSYATGRMKSVWGDDCHEFKPERWLNEKGGLKVVSSNKFPVFSSGPRICPGRELAFAKMKAVACVILHHYDVHVVKTEPAAPLTAIVIHMIGGLKVKLNKRRDS